MSLRAPVAIVSCSLVAGCSTPIRGVDSAFPVAFQANPWVLQGSVWSGPAAEAAQAIGEDWNLIEPAGPRRAWLARYQHRSHADRSITARVFEFPSPESARRAFVALNPVDAEPLDMGSAGVWTEFGLMFCWDALLVEVFGNDASWGSQVQSAYVAGYLTKRLPPMRAAEQ